MSGFVTKKISRKCALGSILKGARSKLNVTIEQAEKATRIPAKYLMALEQGNYEALPADAYNIGYVRTYAQYLKLCQDKILTAFREERSATRVGPKSNIAISPRRTNNWRFLITPRLIGTMVAVVIFCGIVSYIYIQLQAFAAPPSISLKTPTQFTSDKDTVNLAGSTQAGATVLMNSQQITVGPDGSFAQQVSLSPGINNFVIQAKNQADKQSQVAVQVLYSQKGVANLPQSVTTD